MELLIALGVIFLPSLINLAGLAFMYRKLRRLIIAGRIADKGV